MKLRLHAGTLRLRLRQSEVARLAETGRVEDAVTFAAGQTLSWILESGSSASITASFERNEIRVVVPAAMVETWVQSDQTGLEGAGVLIEKDFQCVHPQSEEDGDSYPNPLAHSPFQT